MKAFLAEEWGQEQLKLLIGFHARYGVLGPGWSQSTISVSQGVGIVIAINPGLYRAIVAWGPLLDEDLLPTPQWMVDSYDYDDAGAVLLSCLSSDRVPEPELEAHIQWLIRTHQA